jgi:gluconolactonase
MIRTSIAIVCLLAIAAPSPSIAQVTSDVPAVRPDAIVDLATDDGAAAVKGQWRYSDAKIVEVEHRAAGPDLRASGVPNRAYDIVPHAGAAGFDDSSWAPITPREVDGRRTDGRLSFGWYRLNVTIPAKVGGFATAGSTVVFEVDAEVWVDGKLPVALGQTGAQFIKGFNAPNRVVITRAAIPGEQIQLAVFGANGPLSNPPGNFVWIRSATLDFYAKGRIGRKEQLPARVTRLDPRSTPSCRRTSRSKSWPTDSSSLKARYGCPMATCSSAIRTPTRSTAGRPTVRCRCFGPRAAIPARM